MKRIIISAIVAMAIMFGLFANADSANALVFCYKEPDCHGKVTGLKTELKDCLVYGDKVQSAKYTGETKCYKIDSTSQ